jgi:hypothetical protein
MDVVNEKTNLEPLVRDDDRPADRPSPSLENLEKRLSRIERLLSQHFRELTDAG